MYDTQHNTDRERGGDRTWIARRWYYTLERSESRLVNMHNFSIIVQLRRGTQLDSCELRKKNRFSSTFFVQLIRMVVGRFSA